MACRRSKDVFLALINWSNFACGKPYDYAGQAKPNLNLRRPFLLRGADDAANIGLGYLGGTAAHSGYVSYAVCGSTSANSSPSKLQY